MLTLQRATPADVEGATRVIGRALAEYGLSFEPTGRDSDVAWFGARTDNDDFVARDATGQVVGVVSVGPQGDPGVAWISKLFVAKENRKQGLGRALLEAAHAAAQARGYVLVRLRTRLVFRDAIALYETLGYVAEDASGSERGDVVYRRPL